MLGSFSRNELESNSEDGKIEADLGLDRPRQGVVQNSEDFRSLLNSNSRENSEHTLETVRQVNIEVTRRIEELKRDLNSQVIESINSAINEKILPSIQNTLGSQRPGFLEDMDHRSSKLSRTTEAKNRNRASGNHPRICFNSRDRNHNPRESSTDTLRRGNVHDTYLS